MGLYMCKYSCYSRCKTWPTETEIIALDSCSWLAYTNQSFITIKISLQYITEQVYQHAPKDEYPSITPVLRPASWTDTAFDHMLDYWVSSEVNKYHNVNKYDVSTGTGMVLLKTLCKICLKRNLNFIYIFNSLRPSDAYMRQWSNQHWFR